VSLLEVPSTTFRSATPLSQVDRTGSFASQYYYWFALYGRIVVNVFSFPLCCLVYNATIFVFIGHANLFIRDYLKRITEVVALPTRL
jgi:hypothetical protein